MPDGFPSVYKEITTIKTQKIMMTQEEIKAKFQPREVDSQTEFESIMKAMNHEQELQNHPYIDRKREIAKQRELLRIQKQAINQQLSVYSLEYQNIEAKQKEINRAFHAVKHEFIEMNPRERFIKPKELNEENEFGL